MAHQLLSDCRQWPLELPLGPMKLYDTLWRNIFFLEQEKIRRSCLTLGSQSQGIIKTWRTPKTALTFRCFGSHWLNPAIPVLGKPWPCFPFGSALLPLADALAFPAFGLACRWHSQEFEIWYFMKSVCRDKSLRINGIIHCENWGKEELSCKSHRQLSSWTCIHCCCCCSCCCWELPHCIAACLDKEFSRKPTTFLQWDELSLYIFLWTVHLGYPFGNQHQVCESWCKTAAFLEDLARLKLRKYTELPTRLFRLPCHSQPARLWLWLGNEPPGHHDVRRITSSTLHIPFNDGLVGVQTPFLKQLGFTQAFEPKISARGRDTASLLLHPLLTDPLLLLFSLQELQQLRWVGLVQKIKCLEFQARLEPLLLIGLPFTLLLSHTQFWMYEMEWERERVNPTKSVIVAVLASCCRFCLAIGATNLSGGLHAFRDPYSSTTKASQNEQGKSAQTSRKHSCSSSYRLRLNNAAAWLAAKGWQRMAKNHNVSEAAIEISSQLFRLS